MNKEVLEKEVIRRYVEEKQGQDKIAAELHIGKLKIRNILKSNNIIFYTACNYFLQLIRTF